LLASPLAAEVGACTPFVVSDYKLTITLTQAMKADLVTDGAKIHCYRLISKPPIRGVAAGKSASPHVGCFPKVDLAKASGLSEISIKNKSSAALPIRGQARSRHFSGRSRRRGSYSSSQAIFVTAARA
jgi:hypothetical protein